MITVTLRYGTQRINNMNLAEGQTIQDAINLFGPALGLPESVQSIVNGVPVGTNTPLNAGDSVTFEKKACNKA